MVFVCLFFSVPNKCLFFFQSCGSDLAYANATYYQRNSNYCNKYSNKPKIMYNEDHYSKKNKVIYPRSDKNTKENKLNSYEFSHSLMPGLELFYVKVIIL